MLFTIGFDQYEVIKQCTYSNSSCTSENVEIKKQYAIEYGQYFSLKPLNSQETVGVGLNMLIDTHVELTWPYHPSIPDGIAFKIEAEPSSATFSHC